MIQIERNQNNIRRAKEKKSENNVFAKFLLDKGLYDEIIITRDNVFELADLINGDVKIDTYCVECKERRVFECETIPYYNIGLDGRFSGVTALGDELINWVQMMNCNETANQKVDKEWKCSAPAIEEEMRVMVLEFFCTMDEMHHLYYTVVVEGNVMKKIGQYPSSADVSFLELKEYRKVLDKEDEKELKRANGLFSHGIGVGSFVYLRRVIERMITSEGEKAIAENMISRDEFNKAHVDEKIKMLRGYLPQMLVDNPVIYSIVSKGIHELSEEDCIKYFPVLESFIKMIINQWEMKRREEEEKKRITSAMDEIASNLKKTI